MQSVFGLQRFGEGRKKDVTEFYIRILCINNLTFAAPLSQWMHWKWKWIKYGKFNITQKHNSKWNIMKLFENQVSKSIHHCDVWVLNWICKTYNVYFNHEMYNWIACNEYYIHSKRSWVILWTDTWCTFHVNFNQIILFG